LFKKLTSISIAYKIYIPLVFVVITGISVIIFNSLQSLQNMQKKAKEDIKKELQIYIEHELNKKFQIGLTNAINISLNKQIIDSLKNKNRALAYETLKNISENFKKYSQLENVKIHIHDKEIRSFVRSWKYNKFGDDLRAFRHSLNIVHKDKKALVEVESGREGMLVRGISPIFDNGEFIGTIEFIQDFSSLVKNAKKLKNYSIIVLNNEQKTKVIKKFNEERAFSSLDMILSQDYAITDKAFSNSIKEEFNKELLKKNELVKIGDYYISVTELYNIQKNVVGYILIGASKDYVHRHVNDVKKIFIEQIWILLLVNILMVMLLIYLLNIAIKYPIFRLLDSLKNINKELKNKKTPIEIYKYSRLKYNYHDEIGVISSTINILLRTMSKTFKELQISKEELKTTLLVDPLTNLGNRFKMLLDVSDKHYLAVLDVNFFREINDFYGYEIGDKVLKNLAKRLFEHFDSEHIEVYHINGDEFAILAHSDSIKQSYFFEMLQEFLELRKNEELIVDADKQIFIRLTCGISYDSDNLVNFADIAHKHAKKTNKDILEYTNEINNDEEYKKNIEWTKELRKAIDENRIEAYYQPIVNTKTSKIEKYETLMRLIKEDGTEVSPFYFLDIAKKTRVYKELTKIVVRQAFDKFSGNGYEFSINLSIEDIMLHDVASWIFDLAVEKGVNNKLVIEIVESEGIESFDKVESFIKKAKEHGMKIAIDDFGTGYSNFEYLIKLNADFIKVDGSLIKDIDKDEKLCGVVDTIVVFAKKNDIKVIGEFVSTQELYEKIKSLDIDFAQGYYLGKPLKELVSVS